MKQCSRSTQRFQTKRLPQTSKLSGELRVEHLSCNRGQNPSTGVQSRIPRVAQVQLFVHTHEGRSLTSNRTGHMPTRFHNTIVRRLCEEDGVLPAVAILLPAKAACSTVKGEQIEGWEHFDVVTPLGTYLKTTTTTWTLLNHLLAVHRVTQSQRVPSPMIAGAKPHTQQYPSTGNLCSLFFKGVN